MGTFVLSQTQEHKKLYLIPNANGCNIDFTPVGEANNWECVDDPRLTPDDDTTYVYSDVTNTQYDMYSLPNHTTETGTINYIKVSARGKSDTDAQSKDGIYKILVSDDACANIYKSDDIDLVTAYTTYNNIWVDNPRTSVAWTWSNIDNLQIGIECSSPSVSGAAKILELNLTGAGDETNIPRKTDTSNWSSQYLCVSDYVWVYDPDAVAWFRDLYNIENHTTQTGDITKVVVYATKMLGMGCVIPSGDTAKGKIVMKTGGVVYESDEIVLDPVIGYEVNFETWELNPNTGVAWTWADIDALQIGVSLNRHTCDGVRSWCVYALVHYLEDINPEIRTTQEYAMVDYDEDFECTLDKPEKISVDANQNIKMLNFWSGNRAVYGLSRNKKTMVLTGMQYSSDACDIMECIRGMAENGSEVEASGLGSTNFDKAFRILSFGYKKISDSPLAFDWILQLEYAT
jgi:hypothetical protein